MSTGPYAWAVLLRECDDVARTSAGRNEQLNRAAFVLGTFVGAGTLDRRTVEHHLLQASEANGYVAKDGVAAALATVRSGLDRGSRHPREIAPRGQHQTRRTLEPTVPIISPADTTPKARFLWSIRQPLDERYLRNVRGLEGPFPATLGFLPARGDHAPAMIAAFGIATEPEPGVLAIADHDVKGIHLTKLADGGQKSSVQPNKIMVGSPKGSPIVLAPPNDLLAMCITEGIEDALSAHEATGLGAWAAGSASLMPALADAVPQYIEHVAILAHRDPAGTKGANELARRLCARAVPCTVAFLGLEAAA